MCNRTAISSLILLSLTALVPTVAATARPSLAEACRPFISAKSDGPDSALTRHNIRFGEAVFWRVQKEGTVNHILGTLHSQDRRVAGLSPQQRLILTRSDRLLMEMVPDPASNRRYVEAMYSKTGPGLQEQLPAPMYKRLKQIAVGYGLPPERLDELEPWAAFSQIGRPKPVNAPSQDMVIYRTAMRMEKAVIALETVPALVETLSSLPVEDQITILKDTICNHKQIIRDSRKLLELYLAADLAAMVEFNEQPHHDEAVFERFMEAVIDKRNERIFKRMLPYLEKGGSFIAIGALHLPEEKGLLQLIEQAGYSVTPVQ